jgi:hypothetical protein
MVGLKMVANEVIELPAVQKILDIVQILARYAPIHAVEYCGLLIEKQI